MLRPPPLGNTRRCSASFDRSNYLPVPTEAMPTVEPQQSTLFIPESSSAAQIDSTATTTLTATEPSGFDPKFRRNSMFIVSLMVCEGKVCVPLEDNFIIVKLGMLQDNDHIF